jgi:transcriptional regulator with XRE-family HTH domain
MTKTDLSQLSFGDRLKHIRLQQRYTRPALAKATGIPEKTLEKYEYGQMEPKMSRLILLSETLEISSELLIKGWDPA